MFFSSCPRECAQNSSNTCRKEHNFLKPSSGSGLILALLLEPITTTHLPFFYLKISSMLLRLNHSLGSRFYVANLFYMLLWLIVTAKVNMQNMTLDLCSVFSFMAFHVHSWLQFLQACVITWICRTYPPQLQTSEILTVTSHRVYTPYVTEHPL